MDKKAREEPRRVNRGERGAKRRTGVLGEEKIRKGRRGEEWKGVLRRQKKREKKSARKKRKRIEQRKG